VPHWGFAPAKAAYPSWVFPRRLAQTGYGYIDAWVTRSIRKALPFTEFRPSTGKPALSVAKFTWLRRLSLGNAGRFFASSPFLATWTIIFRNLRCFGIASRKYRKESATIGNSAPLSQTCKTFRGLRHLGSRPPRAWTLFHPLSFQRSRMEATLFFLVLRVRTPFETPPDKHFARDSYPSTPTGNLFWSASKFIAAVGVNNLVVSETRNALLICPREALAHDVGKVVNGSRKIVAKTCCIRAIFGLFGKSALAILFKTQAFDSLRNRRLRRHHRRRFHLRQGAQVATPAPATSCVAKMHAMACWSAITILLRQTPSPPRSSRPSAPPARQSG